MLEKILIVVGILVGIAVLIGLLKLLKFLFIASFANPVVNRIIIILIHVSRIIVIPSFMPEIEKDVTVIVFIFGIYTAILTLYGFGASVFDDTRHETGNVILNPVEGGGFKICSEIVGDDPIGTFISALFYSGIIGALSGVIMLALAGMDLGIAAAIVFSAIGILKTIISLIRVII